MKIFISWYGDLSHQIALLLRGWLPLVVQAIDPFVSSEEIRKGAAWFKKLMNQVNQSDFVFVCLTDENFNAPWLLFEAGAIARMFDEAHVCILLVGDLSEADLELPLFNFQSTKLKDKEDMRKLLQTINQIHEKRIVSANVLNNTFDRLWPKFEEDFNNAIKEIQIVGENKKAKTDRQLLEEINGLCLHLSETLETISDNIKDMKNDYLHRDIASFPKKGIR